MQPPSSPDNLRHIWVQTLDGSVEGTIVLGPTVRLLDDLNMAGRPFLLVEPRHVELERALDPACTIAVNKNTILLVAELSPYVSQRRDHQRLARAPIALEVGPFSVRGFVHVPVGGDPLTRLNQATHPFIAVTSASVRGPRTEYAAGFLAVGRRHIGLAQRSSPVRLEAEPVAAGHTCD